MLGKLIVDIAGTELTQIEKIPITRSYWRSNFIYKKF